MYIKLSSCILVATFIAIAITFRVLMSELISLHTEVERVHEAERNAGYPAGHSALTVSVSNCHFSFLIIIAYTFNFNLQFSAFYSRAFSFFIRQNKYA